MVYGLLYSQVGARAYDAFGDIGSIFQELEWKTPIFSGRVAPKTPNALYWPKRSRVVSGNASVARHDSCPRRNLL
jgi:hypothetical protein